jgi:hypothetical protein
MPTNMKSPSKMHASSTVAAFEARTTDLSARNIPRNFEIAQHSIWSFLQISEQIISKKLLKTPNYFLKFFAAT